MIRGDDTEVSIHVLVALLNDNTVPVQYMYSISWDKLRVKKSQRGSPLVLPYLTTPPGMYSSAMVLK